jgi:type VI secretion system protein ImpK
MLNPYLECSANLLSLVSRLRGEDRGAGLPENFRDSLLAGFDMLERRAFELQLPLSDVQDAKYALTAFVDEAVLSSDWPGRKEWMDRPLQIEFFGDHLAGERFFERVAALRQNAEQHLDVLELYYVCLQLGFEGVYRIRGVEQLMALQVDLRSQIETHRGAAEPKLSPAGIPNQGFIARVQRDVPYWAIVSISAALVVGAYSTYTVRAETLARDSLARVDSLVTAIESAPVPAPVPEVLPEPEPVAAPGSQRGEP